MKFNCRRCPDTFPNFKELEDHWNAHLDRWKALTGKQLADKKAMEMPTGRRER